MCDGAPDECIGCAVAPIVIIILPIVGLLRIGRYIFYDLPKSFFKKKKKSQAQQEVQQAQPQQPHRSQQPEQSQQEAQEQSGEEPEEQDEPQPPSLRIKIPVSNQADMGFTPHIHLRNPNKRPVKNLRWSDGIMVSP
jgi:FtsZ-interacting cell division protein ZipA